MASQVVQVTGLVVPALTNNQVAFLNADAWNAYWQQLTFSVVIPGNLSLTTATTVAFVDPGNMANVSYNLAIDPNGDGNFVAVQIPAYSSYLALKAQVETLISNYQQLKAAMVITNLITVA